MHEKTDIVVLTHNRLAVTKKFIDRLYAHTDSFNLIFVDNGSTDGTQEFLKGDDRWQVISHASNLGVILGRNSATPFLSADFFLNIDNDQFVTKGWLQSLHNHMNKGFDIVGTEAWMLSPPGDKGAVTINGQVSSDVSYYPKKKCTRATERFTYIGCGGMLVKKKVYDKIGLFDERFSPAYFEDPDFCFRAIQAGFKLGWCRDCLIEHLSHQTISTQTLFNKQHQFVKSWNEFKEKWSPYYPKARIENA